MDYDYTPRWGGNHEDEVAEDDDALLEQETKDKKKKRALKQNPFLRRWLGEENAASKSETSDDQSNEKDDSTRGRFRKLFNSLFPAIATTKSLESVPAAPEAPPSIFAEASPPEPPPTSEYQGELRIDHTVAEYEPPTPEPAPANQPEATPEYSYEDIPAGEPVVPEQATVEAEPYALEPALPETPPNAELFIPPEAPTPSELTVPEAQPKIIEKHSSKNALLAFVAAEISSRWRDRKLRKRIVKLEKSNNEQRAELRKRRSEVAGISGELKVQQETVENITNQETIIETAPHVIAVEQQISHAHEQSSPRSEARPAEKERTPEKPETTEEKQEEEPDKLESLKELLEKEYAWNLAMEKRKAIEDKKPVIIETDDNRPESFFDRRHEVLDRSTNQKPAIQQHKGLDVPSFAVPVPVGDVLRERSSSSATSNPDMFASRPDTPPKSDTREDIPPLNNMYNQSIQYGVGAALAIITTGILGYFLFN